ncbi:MAG: hypothetical protein WKG07_07785 [Hymenobacter sp.]
MTIATTCRLRAGLPGWPAPAQSFYQAVAGPYPPASAQATQPSQSPLAAQ